MSGNSHLSPQQIHARLPHPVIDADGHWLEYGPVGSEQIRRIGAMRMTHEHGFGADLDRPEHLPAQVVDHGAGYLAALGALIALARRAREGGSYLVRVSSPRWGAGWTRSVASMVGPFPTLKSEHVEDLIADRDTPFGRLGHVVSAARRPEAPAFLVASHGSAWNIRPRVA